jgi:hypothetical protein
MRWLTAVVVIVVLGLMLSAARESSAQGETNPAREIWALPPVDCGDKYTICNIRVSAEGDLFNVVERLEITNWTQTLYISRRGEQTYSEYELPSIDAWLNQIWEYVPFSDQNIVVFLGGHRPLTLSRFDITSGELTHMPQSDIHHRLLPCNEWPGLSGSQKQISRLGTTGQLLFCSHSDDASKILVNVADVMSQTTLHTFDFGLPWLGNGSSYWKMLSGGLDGNIYLNVYGSDMRWRMLIQGALTELPAGGWRLFSYDIKADEWSVHDVQPEQMQIVNFPEESLEIFSRISAVMPNGDVIYYHAWTSFDNADFKPEVRWELCRFSTEFELVERIASTDFDEPLRFGGVSADGMVLLLGETGLDSAKVVWFGQRD